MRAGLLVVAVLLLFVPLASAQFMGPILNIVLTNQIPYPVQPGQNLTIEIEIQNSGFGDAENYIVEIVEKDPFKLLPGQERTNTFGRISAKSSVKSSWKLIVDSQTVSGDYEIGIKLYKAGEIGWVMHKVFVTVQGRPEIVLQEAEITGRPEPGGQIGLRINIINTGTGDARQLKLSFVSSPQLMPILTAGLVYLGELKPGQSRTADIALAVSTDAEHKTYPTNLTVNYVDESGQSQTGQFSIGIPITGSILLDIIDIRPDFDRQRLEIEVANKGTAEAKAVIASLVINNETVGLDYTSSIKAAKKVSFSFPLVLMGSGYLNLSYTGPGLESNHISKDVLLDFGRPPNPAWIAVLLVVAGAGYWLFIKRKKKK